MVNKLIYIILFLSFLAFSRVIQSMIVWNLNGETNVSYFLNNNKKLECRPKEDSLINYLESEDQKSLFIIIDGYPLPKLFNEFSYVNSEFHHNLSELSDFYKFKITNSQWTKHSLSKILGGLKKTDKKCIYPVFGNNFKPNFVNSSQYFYSKDSICKGSITEFSERLRFYPLKILNKLDKKNRIFESYSSLLNNRKENCSLVNSRISDYLVEFFNNQSNDSDIYFFHDIFFHDFIEKNKGGIKKIGGFINNKNNYYLNKLIEIDKLYGASFKKTLRDFGNNVNIDNIFVLSDHGPRTNIFRDKRMSLIEYRGYFIYYFPLKEMDENIVRIINNL